MIDPQVRAEIMRRLRGAQAEHGVHILYACESGSRAWGFASPDSDYDVRFIYAHPAEWYLAFDVDQRRDVIEYPIEDEIDCSGWDLRKAMHLFMRSNGALLEWLKSPIRYIESGPFAARMRGLETQAVNLRALCYHYSHMARGNARGYLVRDRVRLKKYLYALRPLLAIRYIEARQRPPPIEFRRLVEAAAPAAIHPAIEQLLTLKRSSSELGVGPPVIELNEFIAAELERHSDGFSGHGRPTPVDSAAVRAALNALFVAVLREA